MLVWRDARRPTSTWQSQKGRRVSCHADYIIYYLSHWRQNETSLKKKFCVFLWLIVRPFGRSKKIILREEKKKLPRSLLYKHNPIFKFDKTKKKLRKFLNIGNAQKLKHFTLKINQFSFFSLIVTAKRKMPTRKKLFFSLKMY